MSTTAQNLTLLTDLYELTMMQGYFKNPVQETVIFDAFYRSNPCGNGFAIAAGLDQVIDYIKNLHFAKEDVDYLRSLQIFDEDFLNYLENFHFTTNSALQAISTPFRRERWYFRESLW